MNNKKVRGFVVMVCTVMLAMLWAHPARAQSGHEVSAAYRISETVDLGEQVRVTLQLRVSNNTGNDLLVSGVTLRVALPGSTTREESVSALLRAHSGADLKPSFTVSKAEYGQWEKGGRPRLFLRMKDQNGQELTRVVTPGPGNAVPMGEK